jgi:hypothetical protein
MTDSTTKVSSKAAKRGKAFAKAAAENTQHVRARSARSSLLPAVAVLGLIAAVAVALLARSNSAIAETLQRVQHRLLKRDLGAAEVGSHIETAHPVTTVDSVSVTLYMNGEHTGGKLVTLTHVQYGSLEDIGLKLSPILSCKRAVNEPCKVRNHPLASVVLQVLNWCCCADCESGLID